MQLLTNLLQYLIVGLAVGTLSGLLGVGGGILMVPLIIYLWRADVKVAIGTSLAAMVLTSLAGSIKHYSLGNVNLSLAACLTVGAIVGSFCIGAPLANHLRSETLKLIFGVFLVISGLQMAGVFTWIARLVVKG